MTAEIEQRRDQIETSNSSAYIAFSNVSFEILNTFDKYREKKRLHFRLTYFEDIGTLIIKIPTLNSEKAHACLGLMFNRRAVYMNISMDEFMPTGAFTKTVLNDKGHSWKESDSTFVNMLTRPRGESWPTLVIEAGDSLPRLETSARWWFQYSAGQVNLVICIKIDKANKNIRVLKYFPKEDSNARNRTVGDCKLDTDISIDLCSSPF